MPLILRIDVDKPYGNNNLFNKVISKLREDYYFPAIDCLGYLNQVNEFAKLLNSYAVPAIFYFRNCTAPNKRLAKMMKDLGHEIGFHAENTKTLATFQHELNAFKTKVSPIKVHSFSKHGSGVHKLGKHHYPPYEEDKYVGWATQGITPFYFGNGMMNNFSPSTSNNFYPAMFWIEEGYRDLEKMSIERLIENAKHFNIPVLIHPENYYTRSQVKRDFDLLLNQSKREKLLWYIL